MAQKEPLYPDEKLAFIVQLFAAEEIPYAIGGAIALFYWGEPRATADIDINIFLAASEVGRVGSAFVGAGISIDAERIAKEAAATAQVRLDFAGTAVDLFFADLPFHESCSARAVRVPFGDIGMNVLTAEDLVICKVMFDRAKDWLDVEQVLYTRGAAFDSGYVVRWLEEMLGAGNERIRRFDALAATAVSWLEGTSSPD